MAAFRARIQKVAWNASSSIRLIRQQSPADVQNHPPVTMQKCVERSRIPCVDELPEQLLVRTLLQPWVIDRSAEQLQDRPWHGASLEFQRKRVPN